MHRFWRRVAAAAVLVVLAALGSRPLLTGLGRLVVAAEDPVRADAMVVLNGGTEIFARLMAAAMLFRQARVRQVVINGNRQIRWLMAEYGAWIYDAWKLRKDGRKDAGGGGGPGCRWRTGAAGVQIGDREAMPPRRP